MNNVKPTLYEIIGVPNFASHKVIEETCIHLADKYSPDKNPNDSLAAVAFQEVEKAFETLANPAKRAAYDASLLNGQFAGESASGIKPDKLNQTAVPPLAIREDEDAGSFQLRPAELKGSNTKLLLAIVGSIILFVGVFMPIVSMPIVGSINYFQNGKGDGIIVMALAVISLLLALGKMYRGLWLTGLGSMAVMLVTFFAFQSRMSEVKVNMESSLAGNPFRGVADMAIQSVQLQWGWAIMIVGAGLIVAAAALEQATPVSLRKIKTANGAPQVTSFLNNHETRSLIITFAIVSALVILPLLGYTFIYRPYLERQAAQKLEDERQAALKLEQDRLQEAKKLEQERHATANRECPLAASTLRNSMSRWQDAVTLASSTQRIALAPQISNLQNLRQNVAALNLPQCAGPAKNAFIEVMSINIDAMTLFLSNSFQSQLEKTNELMAAHKDGRRSKAQVADDKLQRELERLATCAPSCLGIERIEVPLPVQGILRDPEKRPTRIQERANNQSFQFNWVPNFSSGRTIECNPRVQRCD